MGQQEGEDGTTRGRGWDNKREVMGQQEGGDGTTRGRG